ncbi:MAG: helix-turn-helix domain-containing protein [bacterium]|nr:helix-turn-helix domain-containing protein [bacterium]
MQIKTVLKQLGLNDRHATIYLACLELGSAPIQKIALRSGFARSTCESVLQSLQEKGFITGFRKKNTRYFSPEEPKTVLAHAEEKVKALKDALPQFSARYFTGDVLPTARLYQGEAGVKNVMQEVLAEARELIGFGSVDDIYEALGDYFPKWTAQRIKQSIPIKLIMRDTPFARERQKLGPKQLREVRLMPESYECSSITFIWNSKIAMFSLKEGMIALVVESNELANIQRAMFLLSWNSLPEKVAE